MLKKIFFLFSLLVLGCGEVFAQDECIFGVPKSTFPWFDEYCGGDKYENPSCIHRLTGIHKIREWNAEHFEESGQTTATYMYSLEGDTASHAEIQEIIIRSLVPGKIVQYRDIGKVNRYANLPPGGIATIARASDFQDSVSEKPFNVNKVQTVIVTSSGNEDDTNINSTFKGTTKENIKLPFLIGVGGYNYVRWGDYCGEYGDDEDVCRIYRHNSYCPLRALNSGSNYCGNQAKSFCLLGPYQYPVLKRIDSSTFFDSGTSLATAYVGGVLWSVAYFLKNNYEWSTTMTQIQATVTAVAIVKSCAKDIDKDMTKRYPVEFVDTPGIDNRTGLGYVSVGCLNDDSDDGFIGNPLSVIKDELYLVPSDSYVKPQLATTSTESFAGLSNLRLSEGKLTPAFSTTTTDYVATIVGSRTIVAIPTASAGGAIKMNGEIVNGQAIALEPGKTTTITIVVTAQDSTTEETYTIAVRHISSDASLSKLQLSKGELTPTFNTAKTDYMATVVGSRAITVTPTASIPGTIKVNDEAVVSGQPSQAIELNIAKTTTITIAVTAQDNITSSTYTIAVKHQISSDASLSNLWLSEGILTPTFRTTTTDYEATVVGDRTIIAIPTASLDGTIKMNGEAVASGQPSQAIALELGKTTTLTIVVTAQDDMTHSTYTIVVRHQISSEASLSNLRLLGGILTPAFSTTTTAYMATADDRTITAVPTANEGGTIKVNDKAVVSGQPSRAIALEPGETTTITIVVTAQDDIAQSTYTIVVNRPLSSDASLSNLRLPGGKLTPAFSTTTTNYVATIAGDRTIIVIPTASAGGTITVDDEAVVSGQPSQAITLEPGETTTITIVVTAQNGINKNTYSVMIRRIDGIRLRVKVFLESTLK